jgi:large subunit ribosomal protein L30
MHMTARQTKPADSGKKMIRVTLVKGLRGAIQGHRASVKGLGLKHREHTVEVEDTPSNRGMINHASYLLKVEE